MANFPTLKEMGVINPNEISRYTLHQVGNVDHLCIVYKRKKNSLLPITKRFKFPRSEKLVMVDSGTQKMESVHEISPFITKAMAELDQILKRKRSQKVLINDIEDEISRIEEEMSAHIASLRSMLERLG